MEYQPDLKKITGNGGEISELDPHGTGADAGLLVGDLVISINGERLRDAIDYRFYIANEEVELEVLRQGETLIQASVDERSTVRSVLPCRELESGWQTGKL